LKPFVRELARLLLATSSAKVAADMPDVAV
jgi:hypothetical protein